MAESAHPRAVDTELYLRFAYCDRWARGPERLVNTFQVCTERLAAVVVGRPSISHSPTVIRYCCPIHNCCACCTSWEGCEAVAWVARCQLQPSPNGAWLLAGAEAWAQSLCDVGSAAAHAAGSALIPTAAAAVILTSTPAAWASTPTIIRHVHAHHPQAGSLQKTAYSA